MEGALGEESPHLHAHREQSDHGGGDFEDEVRIGLSV